MGHYMLKKKKEVNFCTGCVDNKGKTGNTVLCACVNKAVPCFILKIEPGGKNRDRYCPQRKEQARKNAEARKAEARENALL